MTLGEQISRVRRRARTDSNALTDSTADDVTVGYINDGVREFAKFCGISKTAYLTIAPKFDLETNFAVRLTVTGGDNALAATDVALAATACADMSGASIASYVSGEISNTLALSLTLSWQTASWVYTLHDNSTVTASYIEVAAPSGIGYVDFVDFLFGKSGTQTAPTWTGQIPMDCTMETNLPSDFTDIEFVEWNGTRLGVAPWDLFLSPGSEGTPQWYSIKNKKIRVAPYPARQEMFLLSYKYMPTDLAATATSTTCPLPADYHWAPVHFAAAQVAMDNEDTEIYQREMALFNQQVTLFKCREANTTPTLFPTSPGYMPPKVVI